MRVAAFTSTSPGEDIVRLATEHAVDLVLTDVAGDNPLGGDVAAVVGAVSCDVALQVGGAPAFAPDKPVLVPFGALSTTGLRSSSAPGSRARTAGLALLGSASRRHRRDASRLLADASLLVQRTAGVAAEPRLSGASLDELVGAAENAALLVIGLSDRWREEGVGEFRTRSSTARPHRRSSFAAARVGRTGSAREPDALRGRSRTSRRGSGRRARTARASRRAWNKSTLIRLWKRQSGVTKLVCSRRWSSQAGGMLVGVTAACGLLGALAAGPSAAPGSASSSG